MFLFSKLYNPCTTSEYCTQPPCGDSPITTPLSRRLLFLSIKLLTKVTSNPFLNPACNLNLSQFSNPNYFYRLHTVDIHK